jgi:hypothetical protein
VCSDFAGVAWRRLLPQDFSLFAVQAKSLSLFCRCRTKQARKICTSMILDTSHKPYQF